MCPKCGCHCCFKKRINLSGKHCSRCECRTLKELYIGTFYGLITCQCCIQKLILENKEDIGSVQNCSMCGKEIVISDYRKSK